MIAEFQAGYTAEDEAAKVVTLQLLEYRTMPRSTRGFLIAMMGDSVAGFCAYAAPTPRSMRIRNVYTRAAFRGAGVAKAMTRHMAQWIVSADGGGKQVALICVEDTNKAAQGAYAAVGFTAVCRHVEFKLTLECTEGAHELE